MDEIIKPIIPCEFMLKDTYDFVNKVGNLMPDTDPHMVSFDVVSLFTNVPTMKTIDIIIKLAFKWDMKKRKYETERFHGLNRRELKNLLVVCTKKSHFMFGDKYYDQVDGVAMGSPLGPLFANAFMSWFESTHMEKLVKLGVKRWYRYVDDVFAILGNREQAAAVLKCLNSLYPSNIEFTIEHEVDEKLPFLDTTVIRCAGKYTSSMYRKPTFTGVYLNWTSLTAIRYKLGLIRCLAERIWRICSVEAERMKEIERLKQILYKNDYPVDVVERTINKFLERKASPPPPPEQDIRTKRFLKLPYVGSRCDGFAHDLKDHVEHFYPQFEFNIAWQAPMKIESFFPFKDKTKKVLDRSCVVYHIPCSECDETYIGKTHRILQQRIDEHKDSSESACFKHEEATGHKMAFDLVSILDTADSDMKLKVKELLHILEKKPKLNDQLGSQSKYEMNTLIVTKYTQFRADTR